MRLPGLFIATLLLLVLNARIGHCQEPRAAAITPGEIYTLESKADGKLLDVENASMLDKAEVIGWVNTRSDAQRWIAKRIDKNLFTFTNVASGKLLHCAPIVNDQRQVNQNANTGDNDVEWVVSKAGKGYFYLKPAGTDFSLQTTADISADSGVHVNAAQFDGSDAQKWSFHRQTPQDRAPTLAIATKTFDAWYEQYNIQIGKGFWDRAEMMEILLDAYEVTKEPRYIKRFDTMYTNFIISNKADWMYNKFNDDITWAALFCVRGYLLTGNKTYLKKGKEQFDEMYARASSGTFGGGLLWYETKTSKNACINGPAIVACCYLAQATGDSTYYDKAIALYKWSKLYLFNASTGKVNDNIDQDRSGHIKTSSWSSTYNQGTYLGAATMLYKHTGEQSYLEEAERIAVYTCDSMFNREVINNEDGGNDLPGFKGIFARYARMYTVESKKTDLVSWMLLNARVAYNNRSSQNLIQTRWGTRTTEKKPESSFGCSTAVSLLFNCLPMQP